MSAGILMLQGTMSHVGKTYLTAGLCRVFSEMGYRTAPFKAQNLSDKSTLLPDGSEIGTGQAVQARAAGVEPAAAMNPLLLKTAADGGPEMFLHGRRQSHEKAAYYFSHRRELMNEIISDFNRLRETHDIICIEGAGSPAEPNLWEQDIANMGFAREVNAPVLLVGDIERGGVFASLYGTLLLLPESDRQLVKGFIINKFDGERKYLGSAPEILEEKTGLPVLGVLPRLTAVLEEEDILYSAVSREPPTNEEDGFRQIAHAICAHLRMDQIMDIIGQNGISGRCSGRPVTYHKISEE